MFKRLRRLVRKSSQRLTLTKREQFALVGLILTLGLVIIQTTPMELRLQRGVVLSFVTYLLSAFVLREDLRGIEWITLMILPTLWSLSTVMFYFLLPVRWLTRLPIDFFYAVGIYAILLTENIYNVAAERSIQLLRVAQSVGFLITLVVVFLLTNIIFSLHLPFYASFIGISITCFLLSLQSLWSVKLTQGFDREIVLYSFFISLVVGEMAAVLSFWPMKVTIASLTVTSFFYAPLGIIQHYLQERLFKGTTREYLLVLLFMIMLVLFTTNWNGI